MSTFVTALWDNAGPANLARVLSKMCENGHTSRKLRGAGKPTGFAMAKAIGAKCYAFDEWTADAFRRNGIEPIELEDADEYWNTDFGQWCRKAAAMRHAIEHFGPSLWVDFDAALVRDIPSDFWNAFQGGGDLKTPLLLHRHGKCTWRETGREYWSCGFYYYCRRPEIAQRLIDIVMDRREWQDEHALCLAIDELAGGWHGPEAYYAGGWNADYMNARTVNRPCENPVFVH